MTVKNNNTPPTSYQLELADLQKVILDTCAYLNRPIRKSQLIRMISELFESSTPKQAEFAIIGLVDQKKLLQVNFFIVTPEFADKWDKNVTAADEGIIKFLLSLKDDAKFDLFFDVYASERLTPHSFFKYVSMKYPSLLRRRDAALAIMEQLDSMFPYDLSNDFYAEMNDFPTERWFTTFFNNTDCRIIITNIFSGYKYANFQIALVSGKKRSFKRAYQDFEEFQKKIASMFNSDVTIHIKKSLTAISSGRGKVKKKI